jgi:O-antigen/teichoic acid export membrane protein
VSWGLIDQVLSSASNFGLALIAGRSLGARGLGAISVAFSVYLLLLGFQRALVTDPIVIASANWDRQPRKAAAGSALSIVLIGSMLAAVMMMALGWVIGGQIGRAFVVFAVWLVPALVQDFWRSMLFRDQRGAAAAANDGVWVLGMALAAVGLWGFHSDWSIVTAWGVGASAGAILGFQQTRVRPDRPVRAWRMWVEFGWPLGRWLGLDGIAFILGSQGIILLLAAVVSTRDLGGLRATQAIFAPLSLIAPALTLPGLPAMKFALDASPRSARALAFKLSSLMVGLSILYLSIVGPAGTWLLEVFFGPEFRAFGSLFAPIGVGQILSAWAVGMILFLKVKGRGRAIFASRIAGSAASLVGTWVLAVRFGVIGGAWGLAIAPLVWVICTTWIVVDSRVGATSSVKSGKPTDREAFQQKGPHRHGER